MKKIKNLMKNKLKIFNVNKNMDDFGTFFKIQFLKLKDKEHKKKKYHFAALKMKILYRIIHFKKKIYLKASLIILIIAISTYLNQFPLKNFTFLNKIIFRKINNNNKTSHLK